MYPASKLLLAIKICWVLVKGFTMPRPLRTTGAKEVGQVNVSFNGCLVLCRFRFEHRFCNSVGRSFPTSTLTTGKTVVHKHFLTFLAVGLLLLLGGRVYFRCCQSMDFGPVNTIHKLAHRHVRVPNNKKVIFVVVLWEVEVDFQVSFVPFELGNELDEDSLIVGKVGPFCEVKVARAAGKSNMDFGHPLPTPTRKSSLVIQSVQRVGLMILLHGGRNLEKEGEIVNRLTIKQFRIASS